MNIRDLDEQYSCLNASDGASFIKNIHAAKNDTGISTLSLIGFLDRTINGFLPEGRRICKAAPDLSPQEKEILTLHGKIICSAILVCHSTKTMAEVREKTLLFLEYASALVKTRYDFVQTAVNVLSYPITVTGLDWKTVQDASSLDIISYKLTTGIRFDKAKPDYFLFSGKGKVSCNKGVLSIASAEVGEAGAKAYTLFGDTVDVITRNTRDEKLKSSDQRNVEALASFASTFTKTQEGFVKGRMRVKEYSSGDTVNIIVRDLAGGEVLCEVLDPDNPLKGTIVNEELIRGTRTEDLFPYIFEDDVITGAKLIMGDDGIHFSIRDAYAEYSYDAAKRCERNDTVFEAKVTRLRPDINRINWMTPYGFGGISYPVEGKELKEGDTLVMSIYNIQTGNGSMFINLCPPKYGYDEIDVKFDDEESVLLDFVTSAEKVVSEPETASEAETAENAETVGTIASIIANRAMGESSLDAYKALLLSGFLRTVTGDAEGLARIMPEAFFLRVKIAFAQGSAIPSDNPYKLTKERENLLSMLGSSGAQGAELLEKLSAMPAGSITFKVGMLLLGLKISSEYADEVKADREDVRRKICEILGVADAYRRIGEVKAGKYGRTETHDIEFKSSYVFRNDGEGADLDYQGRGQVFEAVCGFLNADGGTLYLGVNDAGEPIVSQDYGLNADIKYLTENYQTVNALRSRQLGHPVIKADTIDHYVLFLNGEKELFFKESLLGNITIEATEDADAIRITVRPAEYEIAYLYSDKQHQDGIAFVRDGGRTIPMSSVQKERRLMSLKKISKEMGFVVTIQEAIDQHRKLIFKNYASGNSGKVKDRFVVPVNLFYNDENVYCYDLESRSYKQFRLKRISSIETDIENPVYPLPLTEPRQADVFRWLDEGVHKYHVKLRMDIAAKNYLLEEYSCAEKLPKDELYEESRDKWILDTHLNGFGAVRRFYLGLADKIEILDTEDSEALEKDIADYVRENILLN